MRKALTYTADRDGCGRYLENCDSVEETDEFLRECMVFRDAMRDLMPQLKMAYDVAPTPIAIEHIGNMMRDISIFDHSMEGLLKAAMNAGQPEENEDE